MANPIPANQGQQLVQIDAQTFAAKYSGKREVSIKFKLYSIFYEVASNTEAK